MLPSFAFRRNLRASIALEYFYDTAKFHVLKDLSFGIQKGQFTSITGKYGSGKSTPLYLLSTMDTAFEGSIRINGEEMQGKSNKWLADFRNPHIGFVLQFHFLLPGFSALRNVRLPGLKRSKLSASEVEHNAYNLLKLLVVEDQANKPASLLSGAAAKGSHCPGAPNTPLIVIGDEPTGNLDNKNATSVFELFRQLWAENGQTMFIVTHMTNLQLSPTALSTLPTGGWLVRPTGRFASILQTIIIPILS